MHIYIFLDKKSEYAEEYAFLNITQEEKLSVLKSYLFTNFSIERLNLKKLHIDLFCNKKKPESFEECAFLLISLEKRLNVLKMLNIYIFFNRKAESAYKTSYLYTSQ